MKDENIITFQRHLIQSDILINMFLMYNNFKNDNL